MKHLRLKLTELMMHDPRNNHPVDEIKKLGVTYDKAVPQSMGEQWWFLNCRNVPDELPEHIEVASLEPLEDLVGYGLTEQEAKQLKANQSK